MHVFTLAYHTDSSRLLLMLRISFLSLTPDTPPSLDCLQPISSLAAIFATICHARFRATRYFSLPADYALFCCCYADMMSADTRHAAVTSLLFAAA